MEHKIDFWKSKEGKRLIAIDGRAKLRAFKYKIKKEFGVTEESNPEEYKILLKDFLS
jgi:hypothetical protein